MNALNSKSILGALLTGNMNQVPENTKADKPAYQGASNGFDVVMKEVLKESKTVKEPNYPKAPERKERREESNYIEKKDTRANIRDKTTTQVKMKKSETVTNENEMSNEKTTEMKDKPIEKQDNKVIENEEITDSVKEDDKNITQSLETKDVQDENLQKDETVTSVLALMSTALNINQNDLNKMLEDAGVDVQKTLSKVDGLNEILSVVTEGNPDKIKDILENMKNIINNTIANTENSTTNSTENSNKNTKISTMIDTSINKTQEENASKIEVQDLRTNKELLKPLEQKGTLLKENLATSQTTSLDEINTVDLKQEAKAVIEQKNSNTLQSDAEQIVENTENQANVPLQTKVTETNDTKVQSQMVKEFAKENDVSIKVTETKEVNGVVNNDNKGYTKTISDSIAVKSAENTKLFKDVILNQIVEKGKLTLTDGKNEMSLDLKPEHLGKISLKIISENGAVMAKIFAGNEQVKSALEANVDSLKASLEAQGIKVQGFSISLGQDKPKGYEQSQNGTSNSDSRGRVGTTIKGLGATSGQYMDSGSQSDLVRKYYEGNNNSINLTA